MSYRYKKILGVVGNPVSHSLSPLFQNFMIEKLCLDYIYIPFEVEESHFKSFFKGIQAVNNLVGLNITIPFKEDAFRSCDILSDISKEVGAVNTVHFKDKKSYGYNTDILGIINVIKDILNISDLKEKTSIVLGAGGGARAAIYGIKRLSGEKIYVVSRNNKRELDLAKWAKEKLNLNLNFIDWGEINKVLKSQSIHLIINATPIGLKGENLPIDFNYILDDCKIFDMAYSPSETPFVKEAKLKNISAVDGIYMLIYQGIESFKLWTGISFDIKEVLNYMKGKLNNG